MISTAIKFLKESIYTFYQFEIFHFSSVNADFCFYRRRCWNTFFHPGGPKTPRLNSNGCAAMKGWKGMNRWGKCVKVQRPRSLLNQDMKGLFRAMEKDNQ